MGFFKNLAVRKTRAEPTTSIPTGRVSSASPPSNMSFYRSRSRNQDLLKELRGIPDEANAIEFITKKTPDGSMASWNFVRYANQGHKMKFYPVGYTNTETSLTDVEAEWREFSSRINAISNAGLDGIIDILHNNAVRYGNQMLEVEVNAERTDIVEVHPIDPRTIHWAWEDRKGKKVVIPYQYNDKGQKIDLSKANVFYVPLDPDGNDPKGTLIMAPALRAIDSQMQVFDDVHAVLHHQGYARDFYSISMERAMNLCPPNIKNDPKELTKWINDYLDNIARNLERVDPDSDIVTFDDVSRNQGQGNATRSVDFRAINEMTDYQTNNGLKQLSTFMNRHTGKTETYSSVEMKIWVQGIYSLQRGSKRLMEEVARLWLRVKGIQAIPVFTHNVVDWQSELDKEIVATSKQKRYAIAQVMGWVDKDTAAREGIGVKNAVGDIPLENVRVSLSNGGVGLDSNEHSRGESSFKEDTI